jgi:hypothetical protein
MSKRSTCGGLGVFGVVAALMSWTVNKSVVWACVHAFCGLFYILYACCEHSDKIDAAIERSTR